MNKKVFLICLIIAFFLAIICFFLIAAPQPSSTVDKANDEIVLAIGSEPEEGFDPCLGWGRYGSPLFQSTLVSTDNNMDIVNDIATSYTISPDGLTWTFNLREDVFFSDGVKLTAKDVAFTFNTAKDNAAIIDLSTLTSVKALNDTTVEFTLSIPETTFIYTIAQTGIVPEHLYDGTYGENPVGSGPFKLLQWDIGQQIILGANENYYGDIPELKKVTILFMSEDAAFLAAQQGVVDVALTNPNMAQTEIEGMTLTSLPTIDNRGLTLPVVPDEGTVNELGYKVGNDVTSDIAIRQSLSYGIDREQLVIDCLNGFGTPAYSECDAMPWSNPESYVEYDLDKAIDILEQAGWLLNPETNVREKTTVASDKNTIVAEFELLYNAGDSTRQAIAIAVSSQAKLLGIDVNVAGVSWDEIDKQMYSQAVVMGWGSQTPKEAYFLYHSDNAGRDYYNPENYEIQTVDNYIDLAMKEQDLEKSFEYWQKVQWDSTTGVSTKGDAPWLWLVNVNHLYFVRDGLDIGEQPIHPHGHSWPLVSNLSEWTWVDNE